jgi:hypothetical protein
MDQSSQSNSVLGLMSVLGKKRLHLPPDEDQVIQLELQQVPCRPTHLKTNLMQGKYSWEMEGEMSPSDDG